MLLLRLAVVSHRDIVRRGTGTETCSGADVGGHARAERGVGCGEGRRGRGGVLGIDCRCDLVDVVRIGRIDVLGRTRGLGECISTAKVRRDVDIVGSGAEQSVLIQVLIGTFGAVTILLLLASLLAVPAALAVLAAAARVFVSSGHLLVGVKIVIVDVVVLLLSVLHNRVLYLHDYRYDSLLSLSQTVRIGIIKLAWIARRRGLLVVIVVVVVARRHLRLLLALCVDLLIVGP